MRGVGYTGNLGEAGQSDRDFQFRYPPGATIHPMPVLVHGAGKPEEDKDS